MKLYLVRHGEAEKVGGAVTRDIDRRLTAHGEASAKMMGQVLARIDPAVRTIVTSPLVRANQTGELFRRELNNVPVLRVSDNLVPGFRPKPLLEELFLRESGGSVVAVGHQPDLSRFIGYLIADSSHVAVAMSTLAIACIDVEGTIHDHEAQLNWLLTPETMNSVLLKR